MFTSQLAGGKHATTQPRRFFRGVCRGQRGYAILHHAPPCLKVGGDRNRANERKEPTTTREEGAVECSLGCVRVFASTNFPEHRLTHRAPGEG